MKNVSPIAQRIKKIREYRNYTQAYVARMLGIRQNTYSQIEAGITELKHQRLERIAGILNVPIDKILDDEFELFNMELINKNKPAARENNISQLEFMMRSLKYEMVYLRQQNEILVAAINSLKEDWTNEHRRSSY